MLRKLILSLLLCSALYAEIIETYDLELFEKATHSLDQNALVLIDVDDTILIPKDAILMSSMRDEVKKIFLTEPAILLSGIYSPKQMLGLILAQMEFEVLNPKIVSIIGNLQKRNIKVIAFTLIHTGPFWPIESMTAWRWKCLNKFGLDFSPAFQQDFDFGGPVFEKGVLYCDRHEKGQVLVTFLNTLQFTPSKILFLDDKLANLQSVEENLGTVDFTGFHYREVEERKVNLDLKLAHDQLLYLAQTGEWISDQKAGKD
jgi:hypothetical protein